MRMRMRTALQGRGLEPRVIYACMQIEKQSRAGTGHMGLGTRIEMGRSSGLIERRGDAF